MKVKLEEVCDRGSSNLAQKDLEGLHGSYPVYGASGYIKDIDSYHQEKEYIAVVKDGAGIGRTMLLPEKSSVIGTLQYLIPKDNVNVKYLYYAVTSMKLAKYFTGATIPHIYFKDYKEEMLTLPSEERQLEVANTLDKVKKIIGYRKQQLVEIDNLIKSQFVEMFGDPFVNPKEYDIIPFDKLVEYMGDIGSNGANSVVSANLIMSDTEDYALMIRTTNFTNNDFVNNVKYVSKEVYDFFKKSQVFGGELIFNKIGSAGINFVMPNLNRPVSLGLNQIMVRINDKVCMTYLHNLLNTEYGKYQINSRVQGAVTKSITKGAIKELPILLPPIELQNHFATFVQQVDKLKFAIQKSLDETQTLFDALMQKYFG